MKSPHGEKLGFGLGLAGDAGPPAGPYGFFGEALGVHGADESTAYQLLIAPTKRCNLLV
jgi:hypothetical protein